MFWMNEIWVIDEVCLKYVWVMSNDWDVVDVDEVYNARTMIVNMILW
jgi:hypothetical protein